jgi:transcriptional regulator with XRE-family HTH domain
MSDLAKRIGLAAKTIRKQRRLTLQDVADRSGLAKSYVWELERGEKTNPSISSLVSLTEALGCSLDDLVGTKKYMEPTLRPEAMRIAVQVDEMLRAALALSTLPNTQKEGT